MKRGKKKWYAGAVDIPEATSGDVSIHHLHKPAGTVLRSDTMRTLIFGQHGEELRFEEPTRWHELREDGQGVWMTDLPVEQRQMDELITKASGRVLVGGLGVGYAVLALAAKPRVKEIVVVERSADIITLVWDATVRRLPENAPPVSVVQADLFDYLRDTPGGFTWALFDIWQADGEATFHETVVPLRRLAHGKVKKVECWNEDIMRAQLYQGLQTRLMLLDHPQVNPAVNLDLLCSDSTTIYLEWAAPFWRWYRDNKDNLTEEALAWVMARYAHSYGRPELQDGRAYLRRIPDRVTAVPA